MGEVATWADVVSAIGIPALFFLVVIFLALKLIPDIVKARQEAAKDQQAYYAKRQEQYDEQMTVVIRGSERGNIALEQVTDGLRQSTDALRANTEIHAKTIEVLTRNTEELKSLRADVHANDARTEKIQHDVGRLLERGKKE